MKPQSKSNFKLAKNLLDNELNGLRIKIKNHSDKGLIGLIGEVRGETKFTIQLQTHKGVKTISKANGVFIVYLADHIVEISGDKLIGTSRLRKKKKYRDW